MRSTGLTALIIAIALAITAAPAAATRCQDLKIVADRCLAGSTGDCKQAAKLLGLTILPGGAAITELKHFGHQALEVAGGDPDCRPDPPPADGSFGPSQDDKSSQAAGGYGPSTTQNAATASGAQFVASTEKQTYTPPPRPGNSDTAAWAHGDDGITNSDVENGLSFLLGLTNGYLQSRGAAPVRVPAPVRQAPAIVPPRPPTTYNIAPPGQPAQGLGPSGSGISGCKSDGTGNAGC